MNEKDKDAETHDEKRSADQTPAPDAKGPSAQKPDLPGKPVDRGKEVTTTDQKEKSAGRQPESSENKGAEASKPGGKKAADATGSPSRKNPTAIESQAAARSGAPPEHTSARGSAQPAGRGWRTLLLWLLALLLIAASMAAAVVLVRQEMNEQNEQMTARLVELQEQLAAAERQVENLAQQQNRASREQTGREEQLAQRLADVEEQLAYQANRLRALSTTTREDWLLAEAEYLLKLADQRMIIERSTEAAQALLEQADAILRDLEDPQLMPLRRAIARDLTELKLAAEVDLEGLYLRLSALAENLARLPVLPRRDVPGPDGRENSTGGSPEETEGPWWRRALGSFTSMFDGLDEYIRIRDHAERPAAILPPNAEQYLQQNLRLMLEKAQLAAMRAETEVYRSSLENAIRWARRFYPESPELDNFINELTRLAEVSVEQNLPDISQSRQMLTSYIDRLHKLEGVDENTGDTEAQQ